MPRLPRTIGYGAAAPALVLGALVVTGAALERGGPATRTPQARSSFSLASR